MSDRSVENSLDGIQRLVVTIFSWFVLMATSVIISGKLIGSRIRLGLNSTNDHFSINLIAFKIAARGEEVTLGFLLFLLSLGLVVCFGGKSAYVYFRAQSGLEIGQWSSLCAISSFLCIGTALICWALAPFFMRAPIIRASEREQQIDQLRRRLEP